MKLTPLGKPPWWQEAVPVSSGTRPGTGGDRLTPITPNYPDVEIRAALGRYAEKVQ